MNNLYNGFAGHSRDPLIPGYVCEISSGLQGPAVGCFAYVDNQHGEIILRLANAWFVSTCMNAFFIRTSVKLHLRIHIYIHLGLIKRNQLFTRQSTRSFRPALGPYRYKCCEVHVLLGQLRFGQFKFNDDSGLWRC